jgi:glycosyltransferase involved in cell wall biosynthesis
LKLVVEGWRSLSHSYAIVNQWQLLALIRRPGIDLRVRDLPFFNETWRKQSGLFPHQSDRSIREIKMVRADFSPDVTWRIAFPYDLAPATPGKTLVYGTSENRIVPRSYLAGYSNLKEALADSSLTVTTPSQWSAEGFRRLGFGDDRIAVVPHGVDPKLFRPRPEQRVATRKKLGLSGFVFMSAGAMTGNKGMDILLKAFAVVAERRADVRLLLKGADRLYSSQQFLREAMGSLPRSQANLVVQRLVYGGEALSMEQMSALYQAADAYVSPYRAEGFNLPVLEAVACGVPVICTSGGSTDDFVTDAFALKIKSQLRSVPVSGQMGDALEPDLDHLIASMDRIVDDSAFREGARKAGPVQAKYFTWDRAIEKIMPTLLRQ